MAFFDTFTQRARSLGAQFFGGTDASATSGGDFGGNALETREMYDAITARVGEARSVAEANGEAFSIEHYRQACVDFGENNPEGQRMVAEGKWNPASYADLSGQDLHGIRLTNPKLIKPEHELSPAIQADYDSFDRDGDGVINSPAVNQFYDRVTFDNKTDLRESIVDPATSYSYEIAKAGNVDGLAINNLSANDPAFVFGACNYTNIHMTNINGGEIIFGDNSRVTTLTIQGISANVTMGDYAKVSEVMPLKGFSMMNLSMGEGALLNNADLTNATISQASEFGRGATLQEVTLGSNVSGVNFDGVTFNNVTFNGSNLNDTSFAGATLNGVVFNNVDVNSLDLSGAKRLDGVKVNNQAISSAYDLQMMQLAGGVSIPTWSPELNITPSPAPTQTASAAINAPTPAQTQTTIAYGGNVENLTEALAGYNPAKDAVTRIIDPNNVPNLGSGNMNVGSA